MHARNCVQLQVMSHGKDKRYPVVRCTQLLSERLAPAILQSLLNNSHFSLHSSCLYAALHHFWGGYMELFNSDYQQDIGLYYTPLITNIIAASNPAKLIKCFSKPCMGYLTWRICLQTAKWYHIMFTCTRMPLDL